MKLAALQLMQQKASKMEIPPSLENGDPPSSESKPKDPPAPEVGSEEEGSSASGLAKVKELAETIASDDGTGGAAGAARGARARGGSAAAPPEREWGYLLMGRVSTADPRSREVIRNACKAVGSISSTAFDVRFNPDIFSPGEWSSRAPVLVGLLAHRRSAVCLATRLSSAWLTPLLSLPQGFASRSLARRKFGTRSSC